MDLKICCNKSYNKYLIIIIIKFNKQLKICFKQIRNKIKHILYKIKQILNLNQNLIFVLNKYEFYNPFL